ncbi:MAG: WbqC family protein [Bacteroidales bacterium]|nr:WbqC family protein [Bacteroidales bacterium]
MESILLPLILSTSYLPPIEYFTSIINSKEVVIEQKESYKKQTFRNRCEIYSSNGKLSLSIPIIKINGHNTKTKDIKISFIENWQKNHWRAIESAYNSSPFFLYYKDDFKKFFTEKHEKLIVFNSKLLMLLFEILGINYKVKFTNEFLKYYGDDFIDKRNLISPKNNINNPQKFTSYSQVFDIKFGFISNLSIIDLIFNEGPNAIEYLKSQKNNELLNKV